MGYWVLLLAAVGAATAWVWYWLRTGDFERDEQELYSARRDLLTAAALGAALLPEGEAHHTGRTAPEAAESNAEANPPPEAGGEQE